MKLEKTIITPTKRLSRYLNYQYTQLQLSEGKTAWSSLTCMPWQAWCQHLFRNIAFNVDQHYQLLNQQQLLWQWQDIIQRSEYSENILQVRATAKQAIIAYERCQQWHIPIFPDNIFLTTDALAFKNWWQVYHQRMTDNQWLDETVLPDYLLENLQHLNIDKELSFSGFDQFTPQQLQFIERLRKAGVTIHIEQAMARNELVSLYEASDKQQEILAAANWVREVQKNNPQARIGILSPRLGQQREEMIRLLRQTLSPEQLLTDDDDKNTNWSISLGKPLSNYPIIAIALLILNLGRRRILINDLSKLLHSHFIHGFKDELALRAKFDLIMRKRGLQEISLKSIYRFSEINVDGDLICPKFIQALKSFEILYLSIARKQTFRQWTETFAELLTAMGWPGDEELDSNTYQTVDAWYDSLYQLARLDTNDRKVSFQIALNQLRQRLHELRYQPETVETPVQVSGLEASAAMQFDYLWIMDMQDDVWPEPVSASPFIPLTCQHEYSLPQATASQRLQQAQMITQRLIDSAKEVVCSYSQFEGERECRPSALIENINKKIDISFASSPQQQIYESAIIEHYSDSQVSYFTDNDLVAGGSALFRDQSNCPFCAFTKHRLYAESYPLVDIGPGASERGKLTHLVLQYLWQRLGEQQKLKYLSADEVSKLIYSVVRESLKQISESNPEQYQKRYTALEQHRLEILIKKWLEIELQRSPFTTIATEAWQTVKFADLNLHLCIDRIDQLTDGRHVIIDYKTGQVSKQAWETENPSDPQLPLYALTTDHEITAVAFASLKSGQIGFKGHSAIEDIFPSIKPDPDYPWQQRLADWQTVLVRLAEEFKQGIATVDENCISCLEGDMQMLSRMHERVTHE